MADRQVDRVIDSLMDRIVTNRNWVGRMINRLQHGDSYIGPRIESREVISARGAAEGRYDPRTRCGADIGIPVL